jgi:hypothetical protein
MYANLPKLDFTRFGGDIIIELQKKLSADEQDVFICGQLI